MLFLQVICMTAGRAVGNESKISDCIKVHALEGAQSSAPIWRFMSLSFLFGSDPGSG